MLTAFIIAYAAGALITLGMYAADRPRTWPEFVGAAVGTIVWPVIWLIGAGALVAHWLGREER